MAHFKVKNYEKFQHYSDRTPPWIKLYNSLLDNYEFGQLSDAGKGHLMMIWLLASRNNNRLPFDPKWVAGRIQANSKVDLDELSRFGFIEEIQDATGDASNTIADCQQIACLEREGETEKKREEKTPAARRDPYEFIQELRTNPAYKHVNFDVELGKMQAWKLLPKNRNRQINKRFVLNWINKIDPPITLPEPAKPRQEGCCVPGCAARIWSIRLEGKLYCAAHSPNAVDPVQNAPPRSIADLTQRVAGSFGTMK